MSYVTNVVLMTSIMREDELFVEDINLKLEEERKGRLNRVEEHAGGGKAMEVNVYLGAFNYLNEEDFIQYVLKKPWLCPDDFALVIQTEEFPAKTFSKDARWQ